MRFTATSWAWSSSAKSPPEEAVAHWYDEVYQPVVQLIRQQGILRYFPGRTETDLYIWLLEHRAALEEELGWEVRPEAAASDLAARHGARPDALVSRLGAKIREAVIPGELESGPEPGRWRRERREVHPRTDRLFVDTLCAVPIREGRPSWEAVDQALEIARREGGRLLGLHVVAEAEARNSEQALSVQVEFKQRCEAAGVPGTAVIGVGGVAETLCDRARWADLVAVHLAHPPAARPLARLGSGFRTLIRRCPRPVLAAPQASPRLERVLLAYDGSPKANEALFVATYLAGRWQLALTVVTVLEREADTPEPLRRARAYLEGHGVQAGYVEAHGQTATAILETAAAQESDLIVMGGYGASPVVEVVLGSVVDQVLREFGQPVLVCR